MLLPFTVQQCQMHLRGTQARNLNYVAWKNYSCIFNICWITRLSLSSWTIVPLDGFTVLASLRKCTVYRNIWKKFQIFLSIFNISLANTCPCLTFFHAFHQTTMMKSQYLISPISHYLIMLHAWHSSTLSARCQSRCHLMSVKPLQKKETWPTTKEKCYWAYGNITRSHRRWGRGPKWLLAYTVPSHMS